MRDWLVLAVVGLGTYAARAGFLVLARGEPPALLARGLGYVAPAVLAAIALPALVAPHHHVTGPDSVTGLAAALVCWLAWRRTHSFPLALLAGLLAGLVATALLP